MASDEPWHGTPSGYGNHGCRCDPCRAASSIYNRAKYKRRHGTITRYEEGCRCPQCHLAAHPGTPQAIDTHWLNEIRVAAIAVAVSQADSDQAFDRLYQTVRAARRAGRTVPHIMDITGLSHHQITLELAKPDPTPDLPCGDDDLRIAAMSAAAADTGFIAARGRRDVLLLRASIESELTSSQMSATAGVSRHYEWELRAGRMPIVRNSPRGRVFQGMNVIAWRAASTGKTRARRRAIRGRAQP